MLENEIKKLLSRKSFTQLVILEDNPETFSAVKSLEKENFLRYCGREHNGIMVLRNGN